MQCMWVGACRWAFVMLGKGLRAQITGPALYSAAQHAVEAKHQFWVGLETCCWACCRATPKIVCPSIRRSPPLYQSTCGTVQQASTLYLFPRALWPFHLLSNTLGTPIACSPASKPLRVIDGCWSCCLMLGLPRLVVMLLGFVFDRGASSDAWATAWGPGCHCNP